MTQPTRGRVLVIGLDCAAPRFVFGEDKFDLPNLTRLMNAGRFGVLTSCDPPITVPAWTVMISGKGPGELGIYGFRNRADRGYFSDRIATSLDVRVDRVWDILGRHGKSSIVIGVPQTYPVRPINGYLVSDLLTPDTSVQCTHPPELKDELIANLGQILFDVDDFRTEEKSALLGRIHAFMQNRFDVAEYLIQRKPWDFFMVVDMGVDRLHHGFWKYVDPAHPLHEPGNPFEHAFRDYYQAVDERVGRLLRHIDDDTGVLIVSDHGAKPLFGGFRINQWLINESHLRLHTPATEGTRIEDADVDWERTTAWSTGGYYGRIYFNVNGREPRGCVPRERFEATRDELKRRLEAVRGPDGKPLGNRIVKPEDVYPTVNGIAPDLLAYFGDLHWRSIGTVGHPTIFTDKNDTGPDDANHAFEGLCILKDNAPRDSRFPFPTQITEIASTILRLLS